MDDEAAPLNLFFAEMMTKNADSVEFLKTLMKSAREGNLCLVSDLPIELPSSTMQEGISLLPSTPIVKQENRYYLQKNWVYETYLLEQIRRLIHRPLPPFYRAEIFEEEIEKEEKLLSEQKAAIRHAFYHPFSIVCGGPGTGKTYTAGHLVRKLLSAQKKSEYRIALAAPTGKAALHLKNSLPEIPCEASTLHRLLRIKPGENRLFSGHRIDADLVIVDESSMMDISLFAHLLEAIGEETHLVLLGDPDQLPPVEAGSVFAECANLFGASLKRCMRTEASHLQVTAQAIRNGDIEGFFRTTSIQQGFDDSLIDFLYAKIKPLFSLDRPDPRACMEYYSKHKILNALRQGPYGAEELNRQLFGRMEKNCPEGNWWAIPILATANLPRLELFNGTTGILVGRKGRKIGIAYFPETGPLDRLPPFELSFCLSIHKSQGSEFDQVTALFPPGSENFGRECLYTAATRARKNWEVFGDREVLKKMLLQHARKQSGFSVRFSSLT